MYEASKSTPQEALRNLDRVYENIFKWVNAKNTGTYKGSEGFPKSKPKKARNGTFQTGR